jgi:anti-anti-sigma regulatory factor
MPPRLRVRRRQREERHVLTFEGQIDGSTACHAIDVLGRTPPDGRELVLDFSGLTDVEAFGLEVLARGLRQVARERRVRILGAPDLLPVLNWLASSLRGSHAA